VLAKRPDLPPAILAGKQPTPHLVRSGPCRILIRFSPAPSRSPTARGSGLLSDLRLVRCRRRHHGSGGGWLIGGRSQEGRAGGRRLLVRLRFLCLATRSIVTLGHCRSPIRFSLRGSAASRRPRYFPRHSGARLLRNASMPSRKSSLI
jgi:hypothetical protein